MEVVVPALAPVLVTHLPKESANVVILVALLMVTVEEGVEEEDSITAAEEG